MRFESTAQFDSADFAEEYSEITSQVALDKIARFIEEHPVFSTCKREDLSRCLTNTRIHILRPDEYLFRKGDAAEALFFELEGDVLLEDGESRRHIEGFFGEESLLGMPSYVYSIVAASRAVVVEIPRDVLQILEDYPSFRTGVLNNFHARLNGSDYRFDDLDEKPPADTDWKTLVGWILTLLSPLLLYRFVLLPDPDLTEDGKIYAAILSISLCMWVFRLLPDYVPGLFAIVAAVMMGVATPGDAFGGFSSHSFFMAMSILGLSVVIRGSGLSYRVLLFLLQFFTTRKSWVSISFFGIGSLLTTIVPTTNGRVAIVAPFLKDVLYSLSDNARAAEGPRLKASLLFGASLLSPVFLTSKSVNFIVLGMLPEQTRDLFHWLYWFAAAGAVAIILVTAYFVFSSILFHSRSNFKISPLVNKHQRIILGTINVREWSAIVGLLLFGTALFTSGFHRLDIAWVALAIMFYLLMFGSISTGEFRNRIDWSFLVFLGALIGMVQVMTYVGLDSWIMSKVTWLKTMTPDNQATADDVIVYILALAFAITLVRFLLPINSTVILFATVLIPVASAAGFNPWITGFLILLFAESFFLPHQASYYLQFQSLTADSEVESPGKFLLLCVLMHVTKVVAACISYYYWESLGLV